MTVEAFGGKEIPALPWNVFNLALREELSMRGVEFSSEPAGTVSEADQKAYEETLRDKADFWSNQHTEEENDAIKNKYIAVVSVDSSKTKLPTNRKEAIEIVDKMNKPFVNDDQGKEFGYHIRTLDISQLKTIAIIKRI